MADTLAAVTDAGVLLASNSHGHPNEPQLLTWRPAADREPGAEPAAVEGADAARGRRTHAVLLSRGRESRGAEVGANEHGVVIASQPVLGRSGSRDADAPSGEGPPVAAELVRHALERAATRRDAVEVLVGLLEAAGEGAGRRSSVPAASFMVADPRGVVLLETASGSWATEDVDRARSAGNTLSIEGFAEKHADRWRGRLWKAGQRRARTQEAAAGARRPADLMAALRDHGSARPPDLPRFRPGSGAVAGACAHAGGLLANAQTTASWVSDLRPSRPGQAGATGEVGTHWLTGTAAPCTSVFWPAAVGAPVAVDAPDAAAPRAADDPAYLWWRHERVHRAALRDAHRTLEPLATGRSALEELWLAEPPTTIEALATAEEWRDAALEGLRALEPADTRPLRVAVQWRGWSSRAHVPGWAQLGG